MTVAIVGDATMRRPLSFVILLWAVWVGSMMGA